jgi:hypothetical protein
VGITYLKMALYMEFKIKNDVGIACLECGYCFKYL